MCFGGDLPALTEIPCHPEGSREPRPEAGCDPPPASGLLFAQKYPRDGPWAEPIGYALLKPIFLNKSTAFLSTRPLPAADRPRERGAPAGREKIAEEWEGAAPITTTAQNTSFSSRLAHAALPGIGSQMIGPAACVLSFQACLFSFPVEADGGRSATCEGCSTLSLRSLRRWRAYGAPSKLACFLFGAGLD